MPKSGPDKWKKYARKGFPRSVVVSRKAVGDRAEGCVIVETLELSFEQAVEEMVPSEMDVV